MSSGDVCMNVKDVLHMKFEIGAERVLFERALFFSCIISNHETIVTVK